MDILLFICHLHAVDIYMVFVLQIYSNVTLLRMSPACPKLLPASLVSGNNLGHGDIFQLLLKPQALSSGPGYRTATNNPISVCVSVRGDV